MVKLDEDIGGSGISEWPWGFRVALKVKKVASPSPATVPVELQD